MRILESPAKLYQEAAVIVGCSLGFCGRAGVDGSGSAGCLISAAGCIWLGRSGRQGKPDKLQNFARQTQPVPHLGVFD